MSNIKALFERAAASLFAVTIVGGVSGLLTMSLAASAQPAPAEKVFTVTEMATAQTAIETVVVYGTKPANYASLVAHRKHVSAAGIQFAALQHR